jgi:hypothetical protein
MSWSLSRPFVAEVFRTISTEISKVLAFGTMVVVSNMSGKGLLMMIGSACFLFVLMNLGFEFLKVMDNYSS